MLLEGFSNRQQKQYNDCLVACCQQILENLGIEKNDEWLWNELVNSFGTFTSFPNLLQLESSLGVVVEHFYNGTVADFEQYIELGLPVIVAVDGDKSDEWPYYRDHAVVIIGFDDDNVYINDPAQLESGLEVNKVRFLLAWERRDYQYAVIRLA